MNFAVDCCYLPVDANESLVGVGEPPVSQGDGVLVDPGAGVAGGDGELGRQVAGVEGRQLLHERHDDDPTIGDHVLDLRVELDVVHHLAGLEGKPIFNRYQ